MKREEWQALLGKYHIDRWFRRENLAVMILCGILLVVIALPTNSGRGDDKADAGTSDVDTTAYENSQTEQSSLSVNEDLESYTAYLEGRLETLLSGMQGVGKVQVMITCSATEEKVVEKDTPTSRSNTVEQDSTGGSRTVYDLESQETTVYITQSGTEEPYVIKTLLPTIEGVAIVAEGAGTGDVSKSITELVQALFGLEANKIKVVKMSS